MQTRDSIISAVLLFFSGFAALVLGVIWGKDMKFLFGDTGNASVATLSAFFLGMSAGSWYWGKRSASMADPLRNFGNVQFAVTVAAATYWAILFMTHMIFSLIYDAIENSPAVNFLVATVLIFPPAAIMAGAVPIIGRFMTREREKFGRIDAMLCVVYIAGGAAGTYMAGFLLPIWLGYKLTFVSTMGIAVLTGLAARMLAGSSKAETPAEFTPAQRRGVAIVCILCVGSVSGLLGLVILPGSIDSTEDRIVSPYDRLLEERRSYIPLTAHGHTQAVFNFGMGTGISAGAALDDRYNVKRVVTCEPLPEIVIASKKHFEPYTRGLFTDRRSQVLSVDGRNRLMKTREGFDIININLFDSPRPGTDYLYTVEHYVKCRERMKHGGMCVQWLPMYRLTKREFGIIARSMLEIFPRVTLWRNNFDPGEEVIALVGHMDSDPLEKIHIEKIDRGRYTNGLKAEDVRNFEFPLNRHTVTMFYCGSISAIFTKFDDYPPNTDDKPILRYLSPLSRHEITTGAKASFNGKQLLEFMDALIDAAPPEKDSLLANVSEAEKRLVRAGLELYRTRIHHVSDEPEKAEKAWNNFVRLWIGEDIE